MPTYNPNVPTGTVELDQDYLNLQANFQQLNIAYGVDHVPFSDTSGTFPSGITGIHTAIHLNPVSTTATNPPNNQPINGYTATLGYGQLFSAEINDGFSTDEALYYLTGSNKLIQLTRNVLPTAVSVTNGYTFLAGGIVLQWGFVAGSSANTIPVLFVTANINFPNNCFNVNVIPERAASSPGNDFSTVIVTGSVSATGFTIGNVGSHTMAGWYWQALGN